jgi:hypothetical protein
MLRTTVIAVERGCGDDQHNLYSQWRETSRTKSGDVEWCFAWGGRLRA